MGKSLPGHHSTKRFVRERYNPPFKVNAKIRHVYTQEVTTIEGQGNNQHHQHRHSHHQQSPIYTVTCHRQTQTEPDYFPESKQKAEVVQELEKEDEEILEDSIKSMNASPPDEFSELKRVDASTSPIPAEFPLPESLSKEMGYPFSGCSQMSVYPPLNYVRKLEDLEKITGHIVIQRFFTKTDDAFGTWLEKQLGMTSKSVSVDTSEFENAKTAELQEEEMEGDDENKEENEHTDAVVIEGGEETEVEEPLPQEGTIQGNIDNLGDGVTQETENDPGTDYASINAEECAFIDPIKCECYLEELERAEEYNRLKELEEQIIPLNVTSTSEIIPNGNKDEDEIETLISSSSKDEPEIGGNEVIPIRKKSEEEDIDEVVRCTLEAYLMAPTAFEDGDEENATRDEANLTSGTGGVSPISMVKSEIDSGRADSIQSQENKPERDVLEEVEGNTSHDSVETVYEMPIPSTSKELLIQALDDEKTMDDSEHGSRVLQRTLSADSCIGTESSGDTNTKNQTNESQSSNDIEGLDVILSAPSNSATVGNDLKEFVDMNLGSAATTVSSLLKKSATAKTVTLSRGKESAKGQRFASLEEQDRAASISSSRSGRDGKTDAEDADASESESEITSHSDHHFMTKSKNLMKHDDDDAKLQGTDLELEEVEEYEGDEDDERDAFDAMVANHLKYSRGLPTATGANRRSRLNRGTQTTKSIEPSTSGTLSPCSSSNSSFDVEIISKSKRITTASSSTGGNLKHDSMTPSNMTMAWHEGGRRRSYLPSSSSSLNLLNMKFSLGKDFESEVSIRVPTKSSTNPSSSMPLLSGGSGGIPGGKTLMSSSSRTQHNFYQNQNRGVSSSSHQSQHVYHQPNPLPSPTSAMQIVEPTELQSLWKDVRTKLDVQVDEIAATIPEEESDGLHVRGNGILPSDPLSPSVPTSGTTGVKLRRNEERIKRSLQRLKKILED